MFQALGTCRSVIEFEALLDSTNITGRRTHSNFAVIDASGAAALYETAGTQYWKYDANDTSQAPNGYVLRTNFSLTGGDDYGIERFNRTVKLVSDFHNGDSLNFRSIIRTQMRDFSDENSNKIDIPYNAQWDPSYPYGYISIDFSICRTSSRSAAVIQGILSDEPPELSTMWTILGQPAAAVAVPYWPVGEIPAAANGEDTAPLCDIAIELKSLLFDLPDLFYPRLMNTWLLRNNEGTGIWGKTYPAEDSIFSVTDSLLVVWRSGSFSPAEMLLTENKLANYALHTLNSCYNSVVSVNDQKSLSGPAGSWYMLNQNYPNPFNPSTMINYQLPITNYVDLSVYNLLGQKVATLVNKRQPAGHYQIEWDASGFAGGVYYCRIKAGNFLQTRKMIYLK